MYALMLLASLAMAEESTFEGTEDAGQAFDEPETTLSAEIGGVLANGNTEYYSVNGLVSGSYRVKRNKVTTELGANLGKSLVDADADGLLSDSERDAGYQETARKYWGDMRYDRFIGESASLYLLGGALVDPFAGYDLRANEQFGYSRVLIDKEETNLVAEVGFDVAEEYYVEGIDPDSDVIFAGRLMAGLVHQFNENLSLDETVEVYENVLDFQDLRLLNNIALSAKLSDVFSVKLSNALTFDNQPVEGYRPLDLTTMVTLVATLL